MSSQSTNPPVSKIAKRTFGNVTPLPSTRGRGRGNPASDFQSSKRTIRTPQKINREQSQEASTSRAGKVIPKLTSASGQSVSRMVRQSPRKKQNTPSKKPLSANLTSSQRKTGSSNAFDNIRLNPDGTLEVDDYMRDTKSVNTESTFLQSRRPVRQSPRKQQNTLVKKPVQSNLPKQQSSSQKVGRRTGTKAFANKQIRLNPDGTERYEDYWTETESVNTEPSIIQPPRNRDSLLVQRRQSPRKITSVKESMKVSTAQKVGRRTGSAAFAGKIIKLLPDGTENFNDYWTDDESSNRESTSRDKSVTRSESISDVPERRQSPRKQQATPVKDMSKKNEPQKIVPPKIGRRTGAAAFAGKNIRLLPDGTENFEDYWTDEESSESNVTEASVNNSSAAVMLDKACSTSKNAEVNDISSVSIKSKKDKSSNSVKHTVNESEKEDSQSFSESILASRHSPNESPNRSKTNTAKQKLFQDNVSERGNESFEAASPKAMHDNRQNEEARLQYSINRSPAKRSPRKTFKRPEIDEQFEDAESDDESENIEPDGVVSSTAKRKDRRSSKGRVLQNEESLRNTPQRQRSKLIEDSESEKEEEASPSTVSKKTAKRSLNFSTSSVSRNRDIQLDSSPNMIVQNKELDSNKSQHVSPRKSSLMKSLNVSRPSRNESIVNEDLENEVESNKKQGKKSVSFSTRKHKVINSSRSSKPQSMLVEDSVSEGDSEGDLENDASSTSIRNTATVSSITSQEKSHNLSGSTTNKSKIIEERENDVEFDKTQGGKSASFRKESEKKTKKVRKVSQSKALSSTKSSKLQSMLIEDSVDEDSDDIPDNDAPSASIKSTGDLSSRSLPRKSHSVSRSTRDKTNITEEVESDLEPDKKQEKKSASFKTKSGKITKKDPKISHSKVDSSVMSSKPQSMLIEDSVDEDDSDDDVPSTSIRSKGDISSSSPHKRVNVSRSTKNKSNIPEEIENYDEISKKQKKKSVSFSTESKTTTKKVNKISKSKVESSVRSLKPQSMLFEDSVDEDDSDNDVPSTSIKSAGDVPGRSSPQKSKKKSASIRAESKTTAKKVRKLFKSKEPESQLVEDSVSEEDSDNVPNNDVPATSLKGTGDASSKSLSRKSLGISRTTRNKLQVIEEMESDDEKQEDKKAVSSRTKSKTTAKIVRKSKANSSVRSTKPKSMLIEDSVDEDSDSSHDNDAPATSNQSLRSSPRKMINHQSELIEEPASDESPENINIEHGETTSISRRFSPRKNSSRKYHSTPKSPMKSSRQNDDDHSIINENPSVRTSSKTASNMSRNVSQIRDADSSSRKSRVIADQVIEEESGAAKDSGVSSANNMSKYVSPYGTTSAVPQDDEAHLQKLSPRKSLKNKHRSPSRSSRKRSKLIEDAEVEDESDDENEIASIKPRKSEGKEFHVSRTNVKSLVDVDRDEGDEFEDVARDSGNEFEDNVRDSGNKVKDAARGSGNEFDDSEISPTSDEVGVSTYSPSTSGKAATAAKKLNKSKAKRRSRALEINNEISPAENEAGVSTHSTSGKAAKITKKLNKSKANRKSQAAEIDTEISQAQDEVGASTLSTSGKAAATTEKLNKSKAKRKSHVENDTEDPYDYNEVDEDMPVPKGKKSKSKKKKKNDHIPRGPLRRSAREPVPRLEFWHGERLKTKCIRGEFISVGIIPGWKADNDAHVAVKRAVELRANTAIKKLEKVKTKKLSKTTVLNKNTQELVDVNLHRPFSFAQWSAVGGEDGTKIPYYLTKTFSSEMVTFGFLDICPLEIKSSQYSPEDNIHFVVQKGHVKVMIRKTTFEFEKFDTFIVPSTEAYCIENLGKTNALLSFCTFKAPFFAYQIND